MSSLESWSFPKVAQRLMMMSESGAPTSAAEYGQAATSRMNEVATTPSQRDIASPAGRTRNYKIVRLPSPDSSRMMCQPKYSDKYLPGVDKSDAAVIREAQRKRHDKITQWVKERLEYLRSSPDRPRDEPFIVYRTYADPRFVDLSIDANDRAAGGNRGDNPRVTNYEVNNLARYTSLTAWLSQWSLESRADGPTNLAKTSVPVLQLEYTADGSIFPSDIKQWSAACPGREEFHRIVGGTHYCLTSLHL